jgi:hypothetical protein
MYNNGNMKTTTRLSVIFLCLVIATSVIANTFKTEKVVLERINSYTYILRDGKTTQNKNLTAELITEIENATEIEESVSLSQVENTESISFLSSTNHFENLTEINSVSADEQKEEETVDVQKQTVKKESLSSQILRVLMGNFFKPINEPIKLSQTKQTYQVKQPKPANPKRNWAAIVGIFTCFIPIVGAIFSLIGLTSERKKLAQIGLAINAVFTIAVIFGGMVWLLFVRPWIMIG